MWWWGCAWSSDPRSGPGRPPWPPWLQGAPAPAQGWRAHSCANAAQNLARAAFTGRGCVGLPAWSARLHHQRPPILGESWELKGSQRPAAVRLWPHSVSTWGADRLPSISSPCETRSRDLRHPCPRSAGAVRSHRPWAWPCLRSSMRGTHVLCFGPHTAATWETAGQAGLALQRYRCAAALPSPVHPNAILNTQSNLVYNN